MDTSVSFWDRLFGKRAHIEVKNPDGTSRSVPVTEKWLQKMIAEGKITPLRGGTPLALERAKRLHSACGESFRDVRKAVRLAVSDQSAGRMAYWLADAPEALFSAVFGLNDEGGSYLPVLVHADIENPVHCIAITQGYCLWILQQYLKNDAAFRSVMGLDMERMEKIAATLPGPILPSLSTYRARFDLSKLEVDPRDWPIVWMWDVAESLIHNPEALKDALGEWNNDMFERMKFVTEIMVLQVRLKERSLMA